MRGIPSLITDIRKKVFTEVARMAYAGDDYTKAEDLPYVIVPGDQPLHRESVFLERAIAGERVRLAMGLPVRSVQTRSLLTEGMDKAAIAQQYYEPPLINIIPYACHACPTNQYKVTENCQNCLAASCQQVCPRDAISFVNGKSHIDTTKCIKCGRCAQACDYNAIIHMERPCQAACGMDAIGADENGKATLYPSYDALMGRAAPAPTAQKEAAPAKAGYGKEQRRRRAELRAKIKACEDEMEACGAREVELDNEINSPEVYNDPDLLRQKSDELSDLRFHQEELFAAWEAAMEEQESYEQSQTEE